MAKQQHWIIPLRTPGQAYKNYACPLPLSSLVIHKCRLHSIDTPEKMNKSYHNNQPKLRLTQVYLHCLGLGLCWRGLTRVMWTVIDSHHCVNDRALSHPSLIYHNLWHECTAGSADSQQQWSADWFTVRTDIQCTRLQNKHSDRVRKGHLSGDGQLVCCWKPHIFMFIYRNNYTL